MTDSPAAGADGSIADTTIRRPRVPTPPDARPREGVDETHDTVIARREGGRGVTGPVGSGEPTRAVPDDATPGSAAYTSRSAVPLRGSRRVPPPRVGFDTTVLDTASIQRAIRVRARRRLAAVIAAVVGLVVVMVAALVVLLFAVGV